MKTYDVYVTLLNGKVRHFGQVHEENEALARCAALAKFGVSDDEANDGADGIAPGDELSVFPAR